MEHQKKMTIYLLFYNNPYQIINSTDRIEKINRLLKKNNFIQFHT